VNELFLVAMINIIIENLDKQKHIPETIQNWQISAWQLS